VATPRKSNPKPTVADLSRARKEVRERGTPTNMTLEEFEAYQKRFDATVQPAAERRGQVSKAELYGRESRLIEEMILRGLPAMVWEQIQIATGQKTQFIVNHGTGEVVEVPVDPKTQVAAFKELRDTALGKPETMKFEKVETEGKQVLQIVIGPAAEQPAPIEAEVALPDPEQPLVLPPPGREELLALPQVYEDREIRKLALDVHLQGGDEYAVRRAVHERFGSRDARRAARKAFQEAGAGAGSDGDMSP